MFKTNYLYTLSLLIYALYAWLLAQLGNMPFLDLPNHSARSLQICRLAHSADASQHFIYSAQWVPYFLGDRLYASLLCNFSPSTSSVVWMLICMLATPLGVILYFKTRGASTLKIIISANVLLYLTTNWFFLSGYTNFCLAVGLAFFSLALLEALLERSSNGAKLCALLALYCLIVVATYLTHLAAAVVLSLAIAATLISRLESLLKKPSYLLLASTPVLLCAVHQFSIAGEEELASFVVRGDFIDKLKTLLSVVLRFNYSIDSLLLIGFLLVLAFSWVNSDNDRAQKNKTDFFIIAALIGMFICLPRQYSTHSEVDSRTLPFLFVFLLSYSTNNIETLANRTKTAVLLCLALATTNLVYIGYHLKQADNFLEHYNEALQSIPVGKKLLPISTSEDTGRINTTTHAGARYLDRPSAESYIPYLFSKRVSGEQLAYFNYKNYLYAPPIHWYTRNKDVDWPEVQKHYDFLIDNTPLDFQKIGLSDLPIHFENNAAIVFRVERNE